MCLAVPGKIVSILDETALSRRGKVSFGGIVKEVDLSYVPEASLGDYVIVHVGFAISTLNKAQAVRVFDDLKKIGVIYAKTNV
ncbi:MAG: HypC/HybG/HupF family hydrogenase formation chaperone [Candidatus Omnitrophota bacterium]